MKRSCEGCAYLKRKGTKRGNICRHCIDPETKEHRMWDNSDYAVISTILSSKNFSYNSCCICGYTPSSNGDIPNYAPLKYWDCDDGWIIGTLCRECAMHNLLIKPKPSDYAYNKKENIEIITDEDPIIAFYD